MNETTATMDAKKQSVEREREKPESEEGEKSETRNVSEKTVDYL